MTSVTKAWAFGLVVLTTLFTTFAQFFTKIGVGLLPALNWPIVVGIGLYAIGSAVMILAFKGGEVSVLYPVLATSYIWVALLAYFWFGEAVHILRWAGILVIIIGITVVGAAHRGHAHEAS